MCIKRKIHLPYASLAFTPESPQIGLNLLLNEAFLGLWSLLGNKKP